MNIRDITAIALFAAFITALGFVPPIYLPIFPAIPISVHSIGPMLAGAILGAKRGFFAIALTWLIIFIGLGVAGGTTGTGVFMGPMAGYIWGFGLAAFIIGLCYQYFPRPNKVQEFSFMAIGGIIALYAVGIMWLVFVTKMAFWQALSLNFIFIPGDIAKIILAISIRRSLKRAAPHAFQ